MELPKYFYFRVKPNRHGTVIEIEDASDADVVEVVRCKDCKRWKDPRNYECPYHTSGDPYIDDDPEEYFFCKLGERKEDDG